MMLFLYVWVSFGVNYYELNCIMKILQMMLEVELTNKP